MMANYAVGDIQGCFEEFKEGLELIKFKSSKDFLWITGDLINRGPDSFKVLEYVFKIQYEGAQVVFFSGGHAGVGPDISRRLRPRILI